MPFSKDELHLIGTSIQSLRNRKGWSQDVLAEKACVKVITLRSIEKERVQPHFQTLNKIFQVLGASLEDVLSEKPQKQKYDGTKDNLIRVEDPNDLKQYVGDIQKALLFLNFPGVNPISIDHPITLETLQSRLNNAYSLRQASRYSELGQSLPALIIAAQRAVQTFKQESQQRKSYEFLVEVNHVTASFLKKAKQLDLAWLAIDRSMVAAENSGSVMMKAVSAYRLANFLLDAKRLEEASQIADNGFLLLEPSVMSQTPQGISIWGAMMLKRSVIAARQGDISTAWQCIGEAKAAARQNGKERNDFWTAFGPTNIHIHEVSIAMELGKWGEAFHRSKAVNLLELSPPLLERRAHYLIDLAKCLTHLKEDEKALRQLLEAEKVARKRFDIVV